MAGRDWPRHRFLPELNFDLPTWRTSSEANSRIAEVFWSSFYQQIPSDFPAFAA